jgi:hypothetical protein
MRVAVPLIILATTALAGCSGYLDGSCLNTHLE